MQDQDFEASGDCPETQEGLGRPRRAHKPKPITAEKLRKAARVYIDRYAPAEAQLRRFLRARLSRSAAFHGNDLPDGEAMIEDLVRQFYASGLLDDGRFARSKALNAHRRGSSLQAVAALLRSKGIKGDDIEAAIAALHETCGDPDLAAAAAYMRKRRLGAYRPAGEREANQDRDLAALARRGFGYETARRVIAAQGPNDLEELAVAAEI